MTTLNAKSADAFKAEMQDKEQMVEDYVVLMKASRSRITGSRRDASGLSLQTFAGKGTPSAYDLQKSALPFFANFQGQNHRPLIQVRTSAIDSVKAKGTVLPHQLHPSLL
jgi:hypothetical protein